MKKAVLFLCCLFILFSGCTKSSKRVIEQNDVPINNSNDALKPFNGDWKIKDLSVTPRVALVSDEFAKEHSTLKNKMLTITNDNISFDSETFFISDVKQCDAQDLMRLFNISLGDAAGICGGEVLEDNLSTTGHSVTDIALDSIDGQVRIHLIVCSSYSLLLWVGEEYQYVGFYEIEKAAA